jgi:hypothetical protein
MRDRGAEFLAKCNEKTGNNISNVRDKQPGRKARWLFTALVGLLRETKTAAISEDQNIEMNSPYGFELRKLTCDPWVDRL